MKSLKVLVSVITLGLVASVSVAQAADGGGKGRGAQTPEQRIERLEQAVGTLTADQKTKITAIYAKAAAAPAEGRGEAMQAAQKEIRAVLTAEQQKKFDEMPQGRGKKKN